MVRLKDATPLDAALDEVPPSVAPVTPVPDRMPTPIVLVADVTVLLPESARATTREIVLPAMALDGDVVKSSFDAGPVLTVNAPLRAVFTPATAASVVPSESSSAVRV